MSSDAHRSGIAPNHDTAPAASNARRLRHLNYRHLHYFWVVARGGSIARASELLCLTPQTISGQIATLEDQIGEKLFLRTGRRLQLTEIGRIVMQYADEMFRVGIELRDALDRRLHGAVTSVTVGVADPVPPLVAYRLLEPVLRQLETLRVVCHAGRFEDLLTCLSVHKIDILIADVPVSRGTHPGLYSHQLAESGISFFAAKRLAPRLRGRFPGSLDGAPMLLPGGNASLRRALEQWFEEHKVKPERMAEFDDIALIQVFGQAGAGVFVAPTCIEPEVVRQFEVRVLARTSEVCERYFAISAERRIKHPAVLAITRAVRNRIAA